MKTKYLQELKSKFIPFSITKNVFKSMSGLINKMGHKPPL